MSINVKENGLLKNVEKKFRPKTFATFAAEHFKLGPSDKKLYLSDEVSAKISKLDGLDTDVTNLDNMAQRGMVEYGYWWGDGKGDTNFFRSKKEYSLLGKIIFENNSDYLLIVSKLSDYMGIDNVQPHQTKIYYANEPVLWYIGSGQPMTETDIENVLSQIRVYAPTGTIDNVLSKEITYSEGIVADGIKYVEKNGVVEIMIILQNFTLNYGDIAIIGTLPQHIRPKEKKTFFAMRNDVPLVFTTIDILTTGELQINGYFLSGNNLEVIGDFLYVI